MPSSAELHAQGSSPGDLAWRRAATIGAKLQSTNARLVARLELDKVGDVRRCLVEGCPSARDHDLTSPVFRFGAAYTVKAPRLDVDGETGTGEKGVGGVVLCFVAASGRAWDSHGDARQPSFRLGQDHACELWTRFWRSDGPRRPVLQPAIITASEGDAG